MSNVRKLVARLHASSVRLGGGRGGIPELTPQDIAGALGMVQDELAREVFCALWWPEGARLTRKRLDELIAHAQFVEWRRRACKTLDAQLAVAHAEAIGNKGAQERAHGMHIAAVAQAWPALVEGAYRSVRDAAMAELLSPGNCGVCAGRGEVVRVGLVVPCEVCGGSGKSSRSNRERARMIGRDESSYRKAWRGVYEWTFRRIEQAEHDGATEFAERLAA